MADTLRSLGDHPVVYAHRGGAALRPENTIAAFDHGLSLGADGLELDVHLSRDGVVVVHHDSRLERTTNGRGSVAEHPADALARLDAGYRFAPLHREGAGATAVPHEAWPFRGKGIAIPRLAEVLSRYPGVPMIVELKTGGEALAQRTVHLVRAAHAEDRVALGSFSGPVLRAARALAPAIRTGAGREETRWALYKSWVGWPLAGPPYREFQVPERSGRTTVVSPRFIAHAHRAGVAVKVWTVDDEADMVRLLDWGVDGIISDRPDVAVRVVASRRAARW